MVRNFNDFIEALLKSGFSMGGGSDDGIYAVIPWGWNDTAPHETPVRWHTGDPDTDPWEWRIRVLEERDDIAYAKLFFKKSGYITRDWYHYFLAARRSGHSFKEAYDDGNMSHFSKRIYDVVYEHGFIPSHTVKQLAGFTKEEKSAFDRALIELQMGMFLTMCGSQQKISQKGDEYSWASGVFCTTERFFGEEMIDKSAKINAEDACAAIKEQVLRLNPAAEDKKIMKFILGK